MSDATTKQKEWCARNRSRINRYAKEYRAKNREKLNAQIRARRLVWRAENPGVVREINLRKYGLTSAGVSELVARQGGGCAVCGQPTSPGGRALHVDHCHDTGNVRGILCSNCNTALGLAGDSPERLRALADYLEASK